MEPTCGTYQRVELTNVWNLPTYGTARIAVRGTVGHQRHHSEPSFKIKLAQPYVRHTSVCRISPRLSSFGPNRADVRIVVIYHLLGRKGERTVWGPVAKEPGATEQIPGLVTRPPGSPPSGAGVTCEQDLRAGLCCAGSDRSRLTPLGPLCAAATALGSQHRLFMCRSRDRISIYQCDQKVAQCSR